LEQDHRVFSLFHFSRGCFALLLLRRHFTKQNLRQKMLAKVFHSPGSTCFAEGVL
jgi:hypothetical protein